MTFGSENPEGHFGSSDGPPPGTGGAGITTATSTGGTIAITNPAGPVTNFEVANPGVASLNAETGAISLLTDPALNITAPSGSSLKVNQQVEATFAQAFTFGQPPRFFAVAADTGIDTNVGYSDVSQAAAGLVAVKTLARLMQILPRFGQGRACRVAIKAGSYASDTQWTIDGLRGLINGTQGNNILFIGTGTVPSAGATAFQGDLADSLCAGFVNATGMNAAGYNSTAYAVDGTGTTTMTMQLNGGGSPGFTANVTARPYGCRIRFDSATTTVGLRNKMSGIIRTTGAGSVVLASALPVAPAAGDIFYIEMPGVSGPAQTIISGIGDSRGNVAAQFVGINFGALYPGDSIVSFCGCEAGNAVASFSDIRCQDTASDFAATFTSPNRGIGLRSTFWSHVGGQYAGVSCCSTSTTVAGFVWSGCESVTWERSASATGLQKFGGGKPGGNPVTETIGTSLSTAHGSTCQVFGPAPGSGAGGTTATGFFIGGDVVFGRIQIDGMGANPAFQVKGVGIAVALLGASGTTGNTDVGLDLTPSGFASTIGGVGCTIALLNTPTATGTTADIRLSDGSLISWATAVLGIVDVNGNRIIAPAAAPRRVIGKFSGGILGGSGATTSYMSDAGTLPAVNLTAIRYPTSARFATRLSVFVSQNSMTAVTSVTLYKNNVATTLTLNIGAGVTGNVSAASAGIQFADEDDYAIVLGNSGDATHTLTLAATLEGP